MSDDHEWETTVHTQGISIKAQELENVIGIEAGRLKHLLEETTETDDLTRSPPSTTPEMFPGIINDLVNNCCAHSEAVPVAVAINILLRFTALIGPMVYLPIGDEQRLLNEFVLMVGPTGLGKGSSNHGPARLFKRVEELLELDLQNQFQAGKSQGINQYPNLKTHTGGLSSGEGLAAALDDGDEGNDKSNPVTDKRILIFESEFSQLMNMTQRSGNIISVVLRNAFDGVDIKPLTKRDKVRVSNPYLCLFANITASELTGHEQAKIMTMNGMLNRFLILWQQPEKSVPFPEPLPDNVLNQMAQALADRAMFARSGYHETHYKKIRTMSKPMSLDSDARKFWEQQYGRLLNRPDCEQVMVLTRRHRLHALMLASLFALLNCRRIIQKSDIVSALAWCEYSRQSVVYIYKSLPEQHAALTLHGLSHHVLVAIHQCRNSTGQCRRTDIHRRFHGKLKSDRLTKVLESLLNHIPPLIIQRKIGGRRGPPAFEYCLTESGTQRFLSYHVGETT